MSTYTSSLGLEKITPGTQAGLWGNTTNNTYNLIDQAITGIAEKSFAGASGTTWTLTDLNGAEDESRCAVLNITGAATGANTVIIPNKQKTYLVRNETNQDVIFQTLAATTPYTVLAGYNTLVFCDGNNGVFAGIRVPGASTLGVGGGGTGKTTFATAGFLKTPGGTGDFTSSAAVSLASEVTGTLPVANGGTGVTSFTSGAVLLGNGTGGISTTTGSVVGQVLTWNGSLWAPATPTTGGITNISAGPGINVSGSTNVTVTNIGVTSLTAGTGISVSNSTGGITITNTGPSLSSSNTWSGTQTFSGTYPVTINTSLSGATISVSSGSYSGLLSPTSCGFGPSSTGFYYSSGLVSLIVSGSGGFNSDGAGNFTIGGNGYKPGGGSWAASSDGRLKDNVQPLTGALAKITSLNPVSYGWKYATTEPTVGFIAQEVKTVIPTAVSITAPTKEQESFIPDGKVHSLGWQNDMIAYLVGAIKELKAEIDALKATK